MKDLGDTMPQASPASDVAIKQIDTVQKKLEKKNPDDDRYSNRHATQRHPAYIVQPRTGLAELLRNGIGLPACLDCARQEFSRIAHYRVIDLHLHGMTDFRPLSSLVTSEIAPIDNLRKIN